MSDTTPTTRRAEGKPPVKATDAPKAPPSVVPSSELRSHTKDGSAEDATTVPVGTEPAGASVDDGVVAEHWHEPSNGPQNTPAGAHRHTPGGVVHVHLPPEGAVVNDISPPPWSDSNPAPEAKDVTATVTADRDFTASYDGLLVEHKKGDKIDGTRGRQLLDTGSPVTAS